MKLGTVLVRLMAVFALLGTTQSLLANDLEVIHVFFRDEAVGNHVLVEFDISWQNSWRNDLAGSGQAAPYNFDAVWAVVKFSRDGGRTWEHATLSTQASDHAVLQSNGLAAAITTTSDGKGVFLHRGENGVGTINWQDVQLYWDYASDGLAQISSSTLVNVIATEMVYIPRGAFQAGDYAGSRAAFQQGSSDTDPWTIDSENAIHVQDIAEDGYYYISGSNSAVFEEDETGAQFSLPAEFPKGYQSFYVMKYEITQGQYADFLNRIPGDQAQKRNITSESSYAAYRGSISGEYPHFEAAVPDRACNFLSIMDGSAYTDWIALRPMTELEYEKAARGDQSAVTGEFAWGNDDITQAVAIDGVEDGTEILSNSAANCAFGDAVFSGGDGGQGPLRGGIFAASVNPLDAPAMQRQNAGASYYGVMELSGNLWERVVTVGNVRGRAFVGTHGDGSLTTKLNFEGNATNLDWPGFGSDPTNGVVSAGGSGLRGGSWSEGKDDLRASDRAIAAMYDKTRTNHYGFRAVRTAPASQQ